MCVYGSVPWLLANTVLIINNAPLVWTITASLQIYTWSQNYTYNLSNNSLLPSRSVNMMSLKLLKCYQLKKNNIQFWPFRFSLQYCDEGSPLPSILLISHLKIHDRNWKVLHKWFVQFCEQILSFDGAVMVQTSGTFLLSTRYMQGWAPNQRHKIVLINVENKL